ncbi:YheC/YheD family protein [Oceanobacillus sojae]|uniref:YheC/YheD family protein n=1 Tax=Oceanobacillus sojae TaxID=582851 RepID=UPI0009885980|nr:YheC/YheD family protein [Oceanobacillus sojae]
MIIGYMRNFNRPNILAKLTSLVAKAKGMEILYFRADDVNMNTKTINGFIFTGSEWHRMETKIPKLIDVSQFCLVYPKVVRFLEKHSYLTVSFKNRISKEVLQYKLLEDGDFKRYVIPSASCSSFFKMKEFLSLYKDVVIKPTRSQRGVGVYRVSINDKGSITIGHNKTEQEISFEELENFYNNKLTEKKHVIQKYITSRTPQGDPFDCRIHMEKNGKGEWVVAKKYIRIGIGQQVISNVNQGGGVAEARVFLKANYPDSAKKMLKELNQLGLKLATKMEQLREVEIPTVGFDIGIDRDGSFYVFEANGAPDTSRLRGEVAMYRTDYYKYLIKNKI